MKKIILCAVCVAALSACNGEANKQNEALAAERDSLMQVIDNKDAELNEIMGSISEIQDGFRRINEAEGRITVNNGDVEAESSRQAIRENMQYIQDAMVQNRALIEQLREKLRVSGINGDKLQKMVDDLTAQLEEKTARVQELEAQLAEKNIVIEQQTATINTLNDNVNSLSEENKAQSQTMAAQDQQIHAAWYVFGTKSELKEQKILQKGDVLSNGNFNKDYFTRIDIRYDKEIKLYSQSAKLLTTHPAGSYKLEKDNKGQYVLRITEPTTFWSVSKYLVIQVR